MAYGGVLILDGRFLLREPKDHFGGCAWTFPKGRPLPGESPEATALRETREETGLAAEVVMRIPGSFLGSRTENAYFIMRPTGRWQLPDDETWALRWVRPDEARALIRQSTDARVRDRDLKVLEAAAGLLGATQ